jgi:crotonobetainyl-CoA:carnitine CoA-transferase CaiB-like acyl-CoA transferase
MAGALDGIVVADFSRVLAGPYATMLLADLGATVIKVERPGAGDDTRAWGPPFAASGQSTYFEGVNRNKLSIDLDISSTEDAAIARRLAGVCDVMIENFKPGGLQAFGLDYATVQVTNPSVIYGSISGFGSGEGRELPGYDLLVQAMGGLMSITGTEEPTKAGVAVVDVLTGLHLSVAVLAALHHRDRTGEGQRVEVSLLGSLLSSMVNQTSAFAGAGVVPTFMGNAHPSISPYEVYPTADRSMIIAVGNDGQFARLVDVLGLPELASDSRFATNTHRVENREELGRLLSESLVTHGADHWQFALTRVGVPCGPINDIAQAFTLAESLGLAPIRTVAGSAQVSNPVSMSATPIGYDLAPPAVGHDRASVLKLLDMEPRT